MGDISVFPSKEYELIQRLKAILPPAQPDSPYEAGIGDDAAVRVCRAAGERLIVTADVSVENVHFSLDTMTFEEIGYRSMVSNLSDCAAMGARPDGAFVQLVFPKNRRLDNVVNIERIYAGFSEACKRWNFSIAGGDLSGGGAWAIAITLTGSVPPGGRLLMRTGISAGDALWVTGVPGQSAAGLAALARWGRGRVPPRYQCFVDAHIAPVPAVAEGMALAANPAVHAMLDLSDGLSKDVATLCFDNSLGFVFDPDVLKRAQPNMADLAGELGADYKEWFYHGGEEYGLLFACDPSFDPRGIIIDNAMGAKSECICLGRFTSGARGVLIHGDNGELEELRMGGWDHI
jgi:thiamine-monophosphate kinase